ncbi:MAG: hypothetical protein KH037_05190 [Burkholderiales bacterium]|nr:hypothetical protein [Burkholderiales bacterium]
MKKLVFIFFTSLLVGCASKPSVIWHHPFPAPNQFQQMSERCQKENPKNMIMLAECYKKAGWNPLSIQESEKCKREIQFAQELLEKKISLRLRHRLEVTAGKPDSEAVLSEKAFDYMIEGQQIKINGIIDAVNKNNSCYNENGMKDFKEFMDEKQSELNFLKQNKIKLLKKRITALQLNELFLGRLELQEILGK